VLMLTSVGDDEWRESIYMLQYSDGVRWICCS